MKTFKYSVTVFDDKAGFDAELKYDDLKDALRCFCEFASLGSDIIKLSNDKGVLFEHVRFQ